MSHILPVHSWRKVSGDAPLAPLRTEDAVVRSECQLMPEWYYLREEARKSWNYFISDSLVYFREVPKGNANSVLFVSKDNLGLEWIELNLRLIGKPEIYLRMVIEGFSADRMDVGTEIVFANLGFQRNVPMFVDGPKNVKYPKEMNLTRIPVLVRLKMFNERDSFLRQSKGGLGEGNLVVERSDIVDREAKSLGNGVLSVGVVDKIDLPNQMVECGAEAANKVPSDQGGPDKVEFGGLKLNDILSSFRVIFCSDRLEMQFLPVFYEFAKSIEVLLRPINFVHYCANWGHTQSLPQ